MLNESVSHKLFSLFAATLVVFVGTISFIAITRNMTPKVYAAGNSSLLWPVSIPSQWKVTNGYYGYGSDHGCWYVGSSGLNCPRAYQLFGLDLARIDGTISNLQVVSPVRGTISNIYYGNYPGNMVSILVSGTANLRVSLVHLDSLTVTQGQQVIPGTPIGTITQQSSNTHIHFSLYTTDAVDNATARAPVPFMNDITGRYGGYDTHITGCNDMTPAGTLNWSAKTYIPVNSTTEGQYQGNITCGVNNYSATRVYFSFNLTGIGNNPSAGLNNNPLHPVRPAAIQIRNGNNQNVFTTTTNVTYNYGTGLYYGSVSFALPSGPYLFLAKLSNTLNMQANNIFQAGYTVTEPTLLPLSGDVDGNNVLDILDYNDLMSCYGSKYASCNYKVTADLDDNGMVDGIDYNIMIRSFSGIH